MRFAGPQILTDPTSLPPTADRFAGRVAKENPGLVERITNAIIPGHGVTKSSEQRSSAQG